MSQKGLGVVGALFLLEFWLVSALHFFFGGEGGGGWEVSGFYLGGFVFFVGLGSACVFFLLGSETSSEALRCATPNATHTHTQTHRNASSRQFGPDLRSSFGLEELNSTSSTLPPR